MISAPSILVCFFMSVWSAPLSFPAKSMKEILPKSFFPSLSEIWRMAWEREDSALAEFWEVILWVLPYSSSWTNCSQEVMWVSSKPMMFILFFLSSKILSYCLLFNKSNSFPQYISKNETFAFRCSKLGCVNWLLPLTSRRRYLALPGHTGRSLPSLHFRSW